MNMRKLLGSAAVILTTLAVMPTISAIAEDAVPTSGETLISAVDYYSSTNLDACITPGIRVIAYNSPMILSSKTGDTIRFSPEAFNNYVGYVPSSVKIVSLPDESAGTLMYNSVPVSEGQSISVLTLSSLHYDPASSEDAEFHFTIDNQSITRCLLRQKDFANSAPKTTTAETTAAWTRADSPVMGYLAGYDPDGDAVEFEITAYPTKGLLTLSDKSTGEYVYSPYAGMSGTDTFSYRLRDCFGLYSPEYTVSVDVRRNKAVVYDDMKDSNYAAAAYDAVLAGIMQTQKTANGEFFSPDESVSRIDFLIMAMKAMGAGEAEPVEKTSFTDDSSLTPVEKGYLSAAYRFGIVRGSISNGAMVFNPDSAITGAEAAVMINGILGLPEDGSISAAAIDGSVPAWASSSVTALTEAGIIDRYTVPANGTVSRASAAVILTRLMQKLA